MKKLLILVCSMAIGAAAFAAPAPVKKAAKPTIAHFSGTVGGYDVATRTLTVKHDGKDTTFLLNDQSQVVNGRQKADASALSTDSGRSVKVDYVMDGATRVAAKIDVAALPMARHTSPRKK